MNKNARIYVAGHQGLVGSALIKTLQEQGYHSILTKTHKELDLINQQATADFFKAEKPEYVFLAAAKVGGIKANAAYRADFIYKNLMIQNNVIQQSYLNGVQKLLFLGSTCIYPKNAKQPIQETELLKGELEYTNEPYAIAKIAGIKLCESYNLQYGTNFLSVMPTNLYGPNDNFDLESSHVLPALIRKIHLAKLFENKDFESLKRDLNTTTANEAKEALSAYGITSNSVEIWGSGKPKREFLWSEDLANACVHIMNTVNFKDVVGSSSEVRNTHINIGTGIEISIKELSELVQKIIGYKGSLLFNSEKPDGTMRKVTDVSKLHQLGWKHTVELQDGVKKLYHWYLNL